MSSHYLAMSKRKAMKVCPRRAGPQETEKPCSCGEVGGKFSHRRSLEKRRTVGGVVDSRQRTACAETAWCVQQTVSVTKWEEEEGGQVRYKIRSAYKYFIHLLSRAEGNGNKIGTSVHLPHLEMITSQNPNRSAKAFLPSDILPFLESPDLCLL